MFCVRDRNSCQRVCEGIDKYKEGCKFSNGLKNYQDMHLCQVRVKSEVHLSSLTTSHPLLIEIHETHAPLNIIVNSTPKIERLNLLKSVRDNVLLSRRADHRSAKGIKSKLLASMNGVNKGTLSQALTNQRTICTDNKLKQLVVRNDRRLKDYVTLQNFNKYKRCRFDVESSSICSTSIRRGFGVDSTRIRRRILVKSIRVR